MWARANYLRAAVVSYSTSGPIKLRFWGASLGENKVVTLAKIMQSQTATTTISKNQSMLKRIKVRSEISLSLSCLKMFVHISRKRCFKTRRRKRLLVDESTERNLKFASL